MKTLVICSINQLLTLVISNKSFMLIIPNHPPPTLINISQCQVYRFDYTSTQILGL